MDAVITPNRALPRTGRYWILAVAGFMAAIPTVIFTFVLHAPFVAPFMGLDVAGLAFALWWVSRRQTSEQVRVSRETIEVLRDGASVWHSQLAFTRIEPLETGVRLALRGKSYRLAAALSPHERVQFAAALKLAVIAANAGSSAARQRPKARP